ncbi:TonB C-terminal domain-containing protein [Variovorax paradoxus]|nr:TonB C-terminal domain-containing protein [Variovorax paradoxus]
MATSPGANALLEKNYMLSKFRSAFFLAVAIAVLTGCAAPKPPPPEASTWGIKVSAALQPYIDYPASKPQPQLPAEFIVWLAPHGIITDKTMFNSSGNAEWDMAASLALRNAYRFPTDSNGHVPYQAIVSISHSVVRNRNQCTEACVGKGR